MSANSAAAAALQSTGLPKAPKVLNIIANSVNCQWQDTAKLYAAQMSMHNEDNENAGVAVQNSSMTDQAKSMSASLAVLRKEMSVLRQMDGYLLCKLMSLHNAITDFKTQEDDMLADSSHDLILEDDEDDIVDPDDGQVPLMVNGRITAI